MRYPASGPVSVPPQSPESDIEHEVIGQSAVKVLLKKVSQVAAGVIVTSEPPETNASETAVADPA